jgi:antitoxin component HigA of HigAB toxin-antitoxin module
MAKNTSAVAINETEPRPAMILRLLNEAQIGKSCEVSLIDALNFRRDQYGLKNSEFAAILGMTQTHYSEFINGKRNLPLNARIRAFSIGVPAEVLLQPGSEMVRQSRERRSKSNSSEPSKDCDAH